MCFEVIIIFLSDDLIFESLFSLFEMVPIRVNVVSNNSCNSTNRTFPPLGNRSSWFIPSSLSRSPLTKLDKQKDPLAVKSARPAATKLGRIYSKNPVVAPRESNNLELGTNLGRQKRGRKSNVMNQRRFFGPKWYKNWF